LLTSITNAVTDHNYLLSPQQSLTHPRLEIEIPPET